jgi:uncharacterized protein
MSTTGMRVVIDTNVFITIIGTKSPFRWIFDAAIEGKLILCVSNDIILEYNEILLRKTNSAVAGNIMGFLTVHPFVERIEPFFNFRLITVDEDDNKFVDCTIAANAYCIVSNDKHFDVLNDIPFPKVKVLSTTDFEKLRINICKSIH